MQTKDQRRPCGSIHLGNGQGVSSLVVFCIPKRPTSIVLGLGDRFPVLDIKSVEKL